jgi:hypothetical protein
MTTLTDSTALPLVWCLTMLAALVIGLIFALLTYVETKGRWPAALLAGFSAAGAAILGVHQILGRS